VVEPQEREVNHTRRGLLVGGFCALVAAILYRWQNHDPIDVLSQRLRTLFPEVVAATPILRDISELAPLRGDRAALAESIFSPDLAGAAGNSEQETMTFLARAVDRDFADGRFVMLSGWTLSETEVRLLAFIAADGT
jgi:hypothetical protein